MKTAIYVVIALLTAAVLVLGYRVYVDEEMAGPNGERAVTVDSAAANSAAVDPAGRADTTAGNTGAVDTLPAAADTPAVPADIRAHIREHADLIRLASPTPYQVIESPLEITGRARGAWYFEASFPVVLVNWDGLIIAEGYATAEGEWMTEEFVPFSGTLEFETPDYGERGALILQKHNASGLPEHDDALEVPVRFEVE